MFKRVGENSNEGQTKKHAAEEAINTKETKTLGSVSTKDVR